jgi:hypothetical protein
MTIGVHQIVMNKAEQNSEIYEQKAQWESFKLKFGKSFAPDEETYRLSIFRQNLKTIAEHNASG